MDDITSKITQLLSDPKGMETIKNFASSFLNSEGKGESERDAAADFADGGNSNTDFSGIDENSLAKIIGTVKLLNSSSADNDSARLLVALKPHLSEERRDKVDKALKLMKLISLLPALNESGILSMLGV